jgi:3-hydroxy-9,10-secoandrosta-1,3,5(10)-triene-9,17-dione monooxygenase reductase component
MSSAHDLDVELEPPPAGAEAPARAARAAQRTPPASPPLRLSREQARSCSGQLATGVSVVTTLDVDALPYGLTMSAVVCVSLDPFLYLVSVGRDSDTLPPLLRRRAFALNVLKAGQEPLAQTFAGKGGPGKFRGIRYRLSAATGVPVLNDTLAAVECRILDVHTGGDHRLVIGEVLAMSTAPGLPLLRYAGGYAGIGSTAGAA